MTRHEATLRMQPPRWHERLWYRRLGSTPPTSSAHTGPWHAHWVRLLPYSWRLVHQVYAKTWFYFWLPCVLCDRPYGGHESGDCIPDPTRGPGCGVGICSRCTMMRNRPRALLWRSALSAAYFVASGALVFWLVIR